MIVTETKLDSSFPSGQFLIDRFAKPFHRDRNKNGGGVMIFFRDGIPSKEIKVNFLSSNVECLFIELNIRKAKWLVVGCYHPPIISAILVKYWIEAKNIFEKTCFKSVLNPSCVDLFVTNSPCGLSDHHNLVATVLKNTFGKQKPSIRYYRDWGKFDNAVFRTELREALIRVERHDYKYFEQTFFSLLNLHVPMKSKK